MKNKKAFVAIIAMVAIVTLGFISCGDGGGSFSEIERILNTNSGAGAGTVSSQDAVKTDPADTGDSVDPTKECGCDDDCVCECDNCDDDDGCGCGDCDCKPVVTEETPVVTEETPHECSYDENGDCTCGNHVHKYNNGKCKCGKCQNCGKVPCNCVDTDGDNKCDCCGGDKDHVCSYDNDGNCKCGKHQHKYNNGKCSCGKCQGCGNNPCNCVDTDGDNKCDCCGGDKAHQHNKDGKNGDCKCGKCDHGTKECGCKECDDCNCCFWCKGKGKKDKDGKCGNGDCTTNKPEEEIPVNVTTNDESDDGPSIKDIEEALKTGNTLEFYGASFNSPGATRKYFVGGDLIFTVKCDQYDANTKKVEVTSYIDLTVAIEAFGGAFVGKTNTVLKATKGQTVTFYSTPSGALNFRVKLAE